MTLEELLEEYMRYPAFSLTELMDVNQIGDFGDAPLNLASRRGALDEMQVLLDNGADVNIRGECQSTPLHGAVLMQKTNAVKLLLEYKADPFLIDMHGENAFVIAEGNYNSLKTPESLEIKNILLKLIQK